MKKLISFILIAYVLSMSTNSYGMLARAKPIARAKTTCMQQRFFHKSSPQHFESLIAAAITVGWIEIESSSRRSKALDNHNNMAILSQQLVEQNKLLKQQIALAEKNKLLLLGIIQQNNLLFEPTAPKEEKLIEQRKKVWHELMGQLTKE